MEHFFTTYKPIFSVIHVLTAVIGMGGALMSDLLFNFYSKDKKLNTTEVKTLSLLSKVVLSTLVLIILSGIALYFSDITKYQNSNKFLAKMTLMAILLINGFILDRYIWKHVIHAKFFTSTKEKNIRKASFICGTISIVSWFYICTLGVLDTVPLSYLSILGIYSVFLLGGTQIALLIEQKEFENK